MVQDNNIMYIIPMCCIVGFTGPQGQNTDTVTQGVVKVVLINSFYCTNGSNYYM